MTMKFPCLTDLCLGALFYLISLDRSISSRKGSGYLLLLPCFIETCVFNANSVDPDQMPQNVASDQVYTGSITFIGQ